MRDYQFSEAQTLIREMALASCLELTEKGLAATGVGLYVGYSASNFSHHAWGGGRAPFMGAGRQREASAADRLCIAGDKRAARAL